MTELMLGPSDVSIGIVLGARKSMIAKEELLREGPDTAASDWDTANSAIETAAKIKELRWKWRARYSDRLIDGLRGRFRTSLLPAAPSITSEAVDALLAKYPGYQALCRKLDNCSHYDSAIPVWDLLQRFHTLNATDPRDKIYAVLTLATDSSLTPVADYSLPTADVYLQFVKYLITHGHGIEMLQEAAAFPSTLDIPSWLPDWSSSVSSQHLSNISP